jgi:hypothetical protein
VLSQHGAALRVRHPCLNSVRRSAPRPGRGGAHHGQRLGMGLSHRPPATPGWRSLAFGRRRRAHEGARDWTRASTDRERRRASPAW